MRQGFIISKVTRRNKEIFLNTTSRKSAIIIWNMIVKGVPYKPEDDYEFLDQKRKRKVKEMKKLIHKVDNKINDLGFQACWNHCGSSFF